MESAAKAPGQLFDVGGHRLHALITGEQTERFPFVLEAGLTAMSSCWAQVQEEISRHTKVLSYDRAGLGWSDPSGKPKDAKNIADDLHALLDAARFPKPFVFVGHSMGGIFGRAYASMYPLDLSGMVLVDASHPEQVERSPDIKSAMRKYFGFLKVTPPGGSLKMASQPVVQTVGENESFSSAQHQRSTVREAEEWFSSAAQIRDLDLGDLPLVIITARQKCAKGWLELQKELASLSTQSEHVIFDHATHRTILTQPENARRVATEALKLASHLDVKEPSGSWG